MKSICREFCPWFSEGKKYEGGVSGGYGCHKYSVAPQCAISQIKGVEATEYECLRDEGEENGLMRELIALVIPTLGTPHQWETGSTVRSTPAVLPVP